MSFLRRLSFPQRVVLVIGLGAALLAAWSWWYLGEVRDVGGWYAYAPNVAEPSTDTYFVVHRREPEQLLVPLALVAFWTAVSAWLLRGRRPSGTEDSGSRLL